jgi:hypothetical protein
MVIISKRPYRPTTSSLRALAGDSGPTPFNGVYMRPNLGNTGTVPASGTLSSCPDIWIANQTPVLNPQTTLATAASYASSSNCNIMGAMSNYIYARAKNGTTAAQTKNVTLYYAPSGVICWPGQWKNNVIPTDQGNKTANITNLAAGAIGVADQVFQWDNPPAAARKRPLLPDLADQRQGQLQSLPGHLLGAGPWRTRSEQPRMGLEERLLHQPTLRGTVHLLLADIHRPDRARARQHVHDLDNAR